MSDEMNSAEPSVSVVIPVYNGASTIRRAVESVLAQDYQNIEIIVVNDGSTDATLEALGQFESKIRVLCQERQGPPIARINGSHAGAGKFVAFLDADDQWLPRKLSLTVDALVHNSDAVLSYSNVIPVNYSGLPTGELYVTPDVAKAPTMEDLLRQLWPILPSSAVVLRSTFNRCAEPYSKFNTRGYEDCFLWLLVREHGCFCYVPEPLVIYQQPPLLNRLKKYRKGFDLFVSLVAERYGPAGCNLIEEAHRSYASMLGYLGLMALAAGDRRQAQDYLKRALQFDALRVRNFLRLIRAYLPRVIAIPLTGRTRSAYLHQELPSEH